MTEQPAGQSFLNKKNKLSKSYLIFDGHEMVNKRANLKVLDVGCSCPFVLCKGLK